MRIFAGDVTSPWVPCWYGLRPGKALHRRWWPTSSRLRARASHFQRPWCWQPTTFIASLHSAVVAGVVTLLTWGTTRSLWFRPARLDEPPVFRQFVVRV